MRLPKANNYLDAIIRPKKTKTDMKIDWNAKANELSMLLNEKYRLVATNIFKWQGLEEINIDSRHLEEYLYSNGQCSIFNDKKYGFLVAPLISSSELNFYGEPVRYKAQLNNYSTTLQADDIIIFNDTNKSGCYFYVDYFISKIVNLEIAKEINIDQLKIQNIFSMDKKLADEFRNNFFIATSTLPLTINDTNIDLAKEVKVLNIPTQYLCNEYDEQIKKYKDEIANFLGLKYLAVEKKERLVINETLGDSEVFRSILKSRLEQRQIACERLNEKFNLNLSVNFNENIVSERDILEQERGNDYE